MMASMAESTIPARRARLSVNASVLSRTSPVILAKARAITPTSPRPSIGTFPNSSPLANPSSALVICISGFVRERASSRARAPPTSEASNPTSRVELRTVRQSQGSRHTVPPRSPLCSSGSTTALALRQCQSVARCDPGSLGVRPQTWMDRHRALENRPGPVLVCRIRSRTLGLDPDGQDSRLPVRRRNLLAPACASYEYA